MDAPSEVGDLYGVWGSGPSDVFAVGQGGVVVHYDGRAWEKMASPVLQILRAVWGSAPNDVFAVGDGCAGIHYDGTAWTKNSIPPCPSLLAVWGGGPNDVFAIGKSSLADNRVGPCLHYDGQSWTRDPECEAKTNGANDIWGMGPGDLFFVGDRDRDPMTGHTHAAVAHFDGKTWKPGLFSSQPTSIRTSVGELHRVWGTAATDVYAMGAKTVHYDGEVWSMVAAPWLKDEEPRFDDFGPPSFGGTDGWSSGPGDVFIVDRGGKVTHFDGHNGAEMRSGTSEDLLAVWGSGPEDIFAVGKNATIIHYSCVY